MMRQIVWLVLLMTVQRSAFGAEDTVKLGLDCAYWNTALSGEAFMTARVLFVRGAYEGATALQVDLFEAAERAAEAGQLQPGVTPTAELFEARYFRQTGYLVLVAGLDEFCKDAQNASIWLTGAMKVVSMTLRGESSEAINTQVSRLRQELGP